MEGLAGGLEDGATKSIVAPQLNVGASAPLVQEATPDHVGTAALGCPAEQSSAISANPRRAALDRTAEGGCPHVVRGAFTQCAADRTLP